MSESGESQSIESNAGHPPANLDGRGSETGGEPLDQQPGFADDDATVLATTTRLSADAFPIGLTPQELSHALQGEMLAHFHLQQFLGGGGMGVVFRALDTTLNRIVAVKVVASRSISSEDLQRRFLIEAQSAARLDHPNIARIHYVGRDRGLPYIVIEYIEGTNLRDLVVTGGPLPLQDALSYTYQIAHALCHAWQRGVVHRDIKPSNILITHEGQAKLVDMGLARFRHVETAEDELTNTGITLGTFDYISPEQARDPRTADTRSDIYSLGCTLFYLLAARPPFAQGNPVQKLLQHQGEAPPDLRRIRADIPEAVQKLVRRMLSKAPSDRPQTPQEVVGEIGEFMLQHEMILPQSLAPIPLDTRPPQTGIIKRHAPWALPLAALLGMLLAYHSTGSAPGIHEADFPPIREPSSASPSNDQPVAATQQEPPPASSDGMAPTSPSSSANTRLVLPTQPGDQTRLHIDWDKLLNSQTSDEASGVDEQLDAVDAAVVLPDPLGESRIDAPGSTGEADPYRPADELIPDLDPQ